MSYFIHDTLWAHPSITQLKIPLLLTFPIHTSSGRRLTSPKEAQVATAGDPGLGTIQGSGQHNSCVDPDLWVFLQDVVVPDALV